MTNIHEQDGLIFNVISRVFGSISNAGKIAKTRAMDLEDLFQIGHIAVWKATLNFNPEKGAWSTYASAYIKGYLLKELNNSLPLKMPVKMAAKEKLKRSKVESLFKEYQHGGETLFLIDSIPSKEEPFTNELLVKRDFEMTVKGMLTEKEKEVMLKKVYQDLTHDQIAFQMGCSRRNVTYLWNNAITKLTKEQLVS